MIYRTNKKAESQRPNWKGIVILLLILLGTFLFQQFSERFVFLYADSYTKIALCSTLLLAPLILYRMHRAPGFKGQIAGNYPTTWLRKWIVMPLLALTAIGVVFAAPLGWLFAIAAWSGRPVNQVDATAVEVGTYAQRKGCDQWVTLRFASADKKTCLDNLYANASLRTGEQLHVGVSTFAFGFQIVSISPSGQIGNFAN
jgi:hypothetical protein